MGLHKTKIQLIFIIVLVMAAIGAGLYFWNPLSFDFGRKELSVEKTVNVVSEIKKIGEFTSACYYEEIAMHDTRIDTVRILGIGHHKKNEIILIGKGRVRAGFDLAKIQESDINAHGDTLDIILPRAEIFDILLNPSDFSIEYESGEWDNENMKPIKLAARKELEENAIANGLLKKAEISGIDRLKNLFMTFGYSAINFFN